MTRCVHFDLASGASGDMLMACLTDAGRRLGTDIDTAVTTAIESLGLGCSVTFVDDVRAGLACRRADVKTGDETLAPHELADAIRRCDLPETARDRALSALEALVAAEASVHGCAPEEVHLHELGSPDTAADLAGVCAGLHALGIDSVSCGPAPVPSGWIRSRHGDLPLPAPVTLELLRGARLRGVDADTELLTPTAAALLTTYDAFGPLPAMRLEAVGTGGGTRDLERPNVCRALLGTREDARGDVVLLEANIDDQTPETLGHAVGLLLSAGALDAWIVPAVMKKSRPGFQLCVLTGREEESPVVEAIFTHTTTLGVRRSELTRWTLERSVVVVEVGDESVDVKVGRYRGRLVNVAPEFEDCARAAGRLAISVEEVMQRAAAAARARLEDAATP